MGKYLHFSSGVTKIKRKYRWDIGEHMLENIYFLIKIPGRKYLTQWEVFLQKSE